MVGFVQDKKNPTTLVEHHVECFYGRKASIDKAPVKANATETAAA